MNKGRRNRSTYLKWKKRLRLFNFFEGNNSGHYEYKTSGKPCSCYACSSEKFSRKTKHKKP